MSRSPRVLLVSHSDSLTGAPLLAKWLFEWIDKNAEIEIDIIHVREHYRKGSSKRELRLLILSFYLELNRVGNSKYLGIKLIKKVLGLVPVLDQLVLELSRRTVKRYNLVYLNTLAVKPILPILEGLGIPIITHAHEMSFAVKSSQEHCDVSRQIALSSLVIAPSLPVAKFVHTINNLRRVCVIPEYLPYERIRALRDVDESYLHKQLGIPADTIIIGMCGTPNSRKGFDLLPQIISRLSEKVDNKNVSIVWIGANIESYESKQIIHDLELLGLKDQVVMVSPRPDAYLFMKVFHIYALPSREDPYPLSALEAASLGIPVVCFKQAGGMEEFVNDICGISVDYLDIDAFANALYRLIDNTQLRATLGNNARCKVLKESTLDRAASSIVDIIHKELA